MVGIVLLLAITTLVSIPLLLVLHALNIGTIGCLIGLTGFYCYLGLARGLNSAWKMSLTYLINNVAMIAALIVVFGVFQVHSAVAAIAIWGLANLAPLVMELFRPMPLRFHFHLISRRVLLEISRFAMPMIVSSAAFAIWYGIDLLLVENLAQHASGSYAAAKTLSQLYVFVPSAITLVLMPRVAAANLSKSLRYLAGGILLALLVSLAGFAIVDIWGQKIISLIFGHGYIDAFGPLVILSIGMCFVSVNAVLEGFLIGRGQPNLAAQAMVVAMVSTGVIGYWFISSKGAIGASLAFTIGAALATITMQYKTWRFLLKGGSGPEQGTQQFMDVTDPALATVTLKKPSQKANKSDREGRADA
jgi:O-antigen/teichoic acid export membrane protein